MIATGYHRHRAVQLDVSVARRDGRVEENDDMLTIGDKFPSYEVTATVATEPGQEFARITDASYPGKWKLYFFWPKDFTFVCPTEIAGFAALAREFADRDCQILGASIDSEYVHLAWRQSHPDLRALPFPMLADLKRELAAGTGVLDKREGVALRATFLVDPEGAIRFASVNDLNVGRNPAEVLRVLDALQTDELCPCDWHRGDQTLTAA
jgi:lipoyl-dependent peroxiredoxin subunit C